MYPNFRNKERVSQIKLARNDFINSKNPLKKYYQKSKNNLSSISEVKPIHAYVETVPICNLACPSCPQGHAQDRENYLKTLNGIQIMSMNNFKKWTKQLVAEGIKSISIYNTNEPLLDPLLFERLEFLDTLGLNDIVFMSNATLLTLDKTDKLLSTTVSKICFSIDAASNATYDKVRPLRSKSASLQVSERFEKVYTNIEEFSKKARLIRPDILIRVSFVVGKDNYKEIDSFLERFKNIVDVIDFQYNHVADFNKDCAIDSSFKKIQVESCSAPTSTIFLRPNGDVFPCCTVYSYIEQDDLGNNLLIGNLSNSSYKEILAADKRRLLIEELASEHPSKRCENCMGNHYCQENYFEAENKFFEPAL